MLVRVFREAFRRIQAEDLRIICLTLGTILLGGVLSIFVTCIFANWVGSLRWLFLAVYFILLLANLAGLVHCSLTQRTVLLRIAIATVATLSAVFSYFMLPSVATPHFVALAGIFVGIALRVPRRITVALRCVGAAYFLFCSITSGSQSRKVFPRFSGTEPLAVRLYFTLLTGFLAPVCVIGTVVVLEQQIRSRRKELRETLRLLSDRQKEFANEQRLSHRLLHNILPKDIAAIFMDRLRAEAQKECSASDTSDQETDVPVLKKKCSGPQFIVAKAHQSASVLFADICGFTALSSKCDAVSLVAALNGVFTSIDRECVAQRIEKIKTIGDCYMACAVSTARLDSGNCAERVVMLAHTMHQIARASTISGSAIAFRAGVHSGPLVSGVIGLTKLCYDLWGDTVNVASRMESSGVPGKTQVSEATYELLYSRLDGKLLFHRRSSLNIKGKGNMAAYLVDVAPAALIATPSKQCFGELIIESPIGSVNPELFAPH
eukprot:TRINITY_DN8289_c0_g3_i1.p1 TRINITY_DN8289_c0_g3~~TRINITY_DN8289_c0_g3_i1.p1  ORF type:complete len:492 (-),score=61.22 TRINITY_DN8289_c0_g3_i1:89-1564(-)